MSDADRDGAPAAGAARGPLDEELAAALDSLPHDDTPGLGDVDALRTFVSGMLDLADDPSDTDPVEREDRRVPGPSGAPVVAVRIYRAAGLEARVPGLVWCHGGAFVVGGLGAADRRCATYSQALGIVVVSVAYRLAPEHPFPAAVEDVAAVTRWVVDEAPVLGVDPARVAVGGSSAGATLAAAVALMARDGGGPRPALQVLLQPALDDRCETPSSRAVVDPRVFRRQAQREMWQHYLGPAGVGASVSPYAAPARARDLAGLAPAVVLTAEHDPMRDEGRDYVARLRAHGVPTDHLDVPGAYHGFEELAPGAQASRRAREWVLDALAGGLDLW